MAEEPGSPECGRAASLDRDLPGTVERPTRRDLVARQGAQPDPWRGAGPAGHTVGLGLHRGVGSLRGLGRRPERPDQRSRRRRADRRDRVLFRRDAQRHHRGGARLGGAGTRPCIVRCGRPAGAGDPPDAAARIGPAPRRWQSARSRRAAPHRGPHRDGDRRRPRADSARLLRTPRSSRRPPRQGPAARPELSRPSLPRPRARRSGGVQLAQRHRARIRADRLSGRRHAHRLDPQGDPAIRPGADRGVGRRHRRAQPGRGLRARDASAVAPPADLPARRRAAAGSRAPRTGCGIATWRCTTMSRWRTMPISRACNAS